VIIVLCISFIGNALVIAGVEKFRSRRVFFLAPINMDLISFLSSRLWNGSSVFFRMITWTFIEFELFFISEYGTLGGNRI